MAKRTGHTLLGHINLPEMQPPKKCGECIFCRGKQAAEDTPGCGPVTEHAYIFQTRTGDQPQYPVNIRAKITQYFELVMIDIDGLYIFYTPSWVDIHMATSAINDLAKTIPNSHLKTITCIES